MDFIRTKEVRSEDKISFISANGQKDVDGVPKKGMVERGCNIIGLLFFFALTFILSVGYFYLFYHEGEMPPLTGFTIFFTVLFIASIFILYLLFSGNTEAKYHFEVVIDKRNEMVTVSDCLKKHSQSISFGEVSHFQIVKFRGGSSNSVNGVNSGSSNNRKGYETLHLVLKNENRILLRKLAIPFNRYGFSKDNLSQLLNYISVPIKFPKKYNINDDFSKETKEYEFKSRSYFTGNKSPRIQLMSSDEIEGIKFKANKKLGGQLVKYLFFAALISIICFLSYSIFSMPMAGILGLDIFISVFKILTLTFCFSIVLLTIVLMERQASAVQIAFTPEYLLIYKKWSLPFGKKWFEKVNKLDRKKIRDIDIALDSNGEFVLNVITKEEIHLHFYNFMKSLAALKYTTLDRLNQFYKISIWRTSVTPSVYKTTLGDLITAQNFLRLQLLKELPRRSLDKDALQSLNQ